MPAEVLGRGVESGLVGRGDVEDEKAGYGEVDGVNGFHARQDAPLAAGVWAGSPGRAARGLDPAVDPGDGEH
ncbi:hypothetical protein SNE510_72510 [Streptomyces sp. NE5-10]|nr:hypothetical protein SNE510_72510 [Streptomyces sp. NE5-10]